MGTTTDDRGRIYLPKKIREKFGDEYRIVELPNRVVLLPLPDDPLESLHEAVGDAFEGKSRDELATAARATAKADLAQEHSNTGEEYRVYVETDFLLALAKSDDWLQEAAREALKEHDDIHTSINAYAEFLLYAYDEGEGYTIDVPQAVTALVEQVPVRPDEHEQAVLTAAVLADEHGLTPYDAIHAGTAIATDEPVLSSEGAYSELALEHVTLAPEDSEEE